MAKLTQVNTNGSLSVVIPKTVTGNHWKKGEYVSVEEYATGVIIVGKKNYFEQQSLEDFYKNVERIINDVRSGRYQISSVAREERDRMFLKDLISEQLMTL